MSDAGGGCGAEPGGEAGGRRRRIWCRQPSEDRAARRRAVLGPTGSASVAQVSAPVLLSRGVGLLVGLAADRVVGDPRRGHPVAAFGRYAAWVERRAYRDDPAAGVAYLVATAGPVVVLGVVAERAGRAWWPAHAALSAVATWAVVGSRSLVVEGLAMADALDAADLAAARDRLPHLCGRDPAGLDAPGLARATVESLAENASDAVGCPLWWGAVAGLPGLLGHRAVNTLDAMVGHRSPRYARFGAASARCDDVLGLVPARLTGVLACATAPVVGGSAAEGWRVMRRDHAAHPSPNGGWPESALAGALGLRLGGANVYAGRVERRPILGDGREPGAVDVRRAARLVTVTSWAGAVVAAALCALVGAVVGRNPRRGTGARFAATRKGG